MGKCWDYKVSNITAKVLGNPRVRQGSRVNVVTMEAEAKPRAEEKPSMGKFQKKKKM